MQLTPHTGTETIIIIDTCKFTVDATHTPHGDGNNIICQSSKLILDATHTPHGDGNRKSVALNTILIIDATHTPHGDGNILYIVYIICTIRCNSHPTRGRKHPESVEQIPRLLMQLTPHTGTETLETPSDTVFAAMQLTPHTGTETIYRYVINNNVFRCNSHPTRGRKPAT